jgi:acyl-CoA dehydrogenase
VIDRAIQVHGGAGISDDTPLAALYAWHRAMRIFDGPDEVHLRSIARHELRTPPRFTGAVPFASPGAAAAGALSTGALSTGRDEEGPA